MFFRNLIFESPVLFHVPFTPYFVLLGKPSYSIFKMFNLVFGRFAVLVHFSDYFIQRAILRVHAFIVNQILDLGLVSATLYCLSYSCER